MIKNLEITKKQILIVVAISLGTIFLSFITIIYAQFNSGDSFFTGRTFSSQQDLYTYLSWIQQGREGHIWLQQLYTSEIQTANFFHPVFFLVGAAARVLHISNLTAYFLLKALAGFAFLITSYFLIASFVKDVSQRYIAFALVCFSAGIAAAFADISKTIWLYEFNSFTDLSSSALDPLGLTLVFSVFILVVNKFQYRSWKYLLLAGLFTNLLALIHSYELILVFVVLGTYGLWEWIHSKEKILFINILYLGIVTTPAVLWQIYVLSNNQALGIWAFMQSKVEVSSIGIFIIEYGFLLALALIGAFIVRKEQKYSLLFWWLFTGIILIYTPLFANFQRKFLVGYHVVLSIFASYVIMVFISIFMSDAKRWRKNVFIATLILFLSLTNIYGIFAQISDYKNKRQLYYITENELSALQWFKQQNVIEPGIVLADYNLSNLIPGITGAKVYVGHYDQTVNATSKYYLAKNIFDSHLFLPNGEKFLKTENIKYVLLHYKVDLPYLKNVYSNPDIEIYKVQ